MNLTVRKFVLTKKGVKKLLRIKRYVFTEIYDFSKFTQRKPGKFGKFTSYHPYPDGYRIRWSRWDI